MFKEFEIYKVKQGPKQLVFGKEKIMDSKDIGKIVMVTNVIHSIDESTKCQVVYANPHEAGKLAWFTEDELEYIGNADEDVINEIMSLNHEYDHRDETIEYCKENINGKLTRNSMEFLYSKIGYHSKYSKTGDVLDIGIDQYDWSTGMKPVFEAIFGNDLDKALSEYDKTYHNSEVRGNIIKFYNEVNKGD